MQYPLYTAINQIMPPHADHFGVHDMYFLYTAINEITEVTMMTAGVGHAPAQAAAAYGNPHVNITLAVAIYDPYMYFLHITVNQINFHTEITITMAEVYHVLLQATYDDPHVTISLYESRTDGVGLGPL
jgi:hypothetical protein